MAGALDLTGQWELDRERSESMYPHMKLLGCDEIAALASEKLILKMHVVQTEDTLSVWQRSQLGIVFRKLHLNQPTPETSSQGDRVVNVTCSRDKIVVETKFKGGKLTDTRTIHEEGSDIILVTNLHLKVGGREKRTVRYFRKVGDPDPEILNTPVEKIATMAGLPPPTASAGGAESGDAMATESGPGN